MRKKGFKERILLLSGFEKDWLEEFPRLNITPVIASVEEANWCAEFFKKKGLKVSVHLKVDTGMHRFGIDEKRISQVVSVLKNSYTKVEGIMTHLASSEEPESELTKSQLENLKKILKYLKSLGIFPEYVHFANTGGIIFLQEKGNLVRPGIGLFGGYPSKRAKELIKLYPVMTLYSKIIEVKELKPGERAGYGGAFKAERKTLLGLVPVGYGDGYPRILGGRGFASVRGKRVKVVGRVSMKALYVDITDVPGVKKGDEVILLGGENSEVPADELAELAQTISYELFCNLGRGINREYIKC